MLLNPQTLSLQNIPILVYRHLHSVDYYIVGLLKQQEKEEFNTVLLLKKLNTVDMHC